MLYNARTVVWVTTRGPRSAPSSYRDFLLAARTGGLATRRIWTPDPYPRHLMKGVTRRARGHELRLLMPWPPQLPHTYPCPQALPRDLEPRGGPPIACRGTSPLKIHHVALKSNESHTAFPRSPHLMTPLLLGSDEILLFVY